MESKKDGRMDGWIKVWWANGLEGKWINETDGAWMEKRWYRVGHDQRHWQIYLCSVLNQPPFIFHTMTELYLTTNRLLLFISKNNWNNINPAYIDNTIIKFSSNIHCLLEKKYAMTSESFVVMSAIQKPIIITIVW